MINYQIFLIDLSLTRRVFPSLTRSLVSVSLSCLDGLRVGRIIFVVFQTKRDEIGGMKDEGWKRVQRKGVAACCVVDVGHGPSTPSSSLYTRLKRARESGGGVVNLVDFVSIELTRRLSVLLTGGC